MEITRDTVLQWLEEERRNQTWLAEQCGVSDQAVSNWLREKNSRPISAGAQITIRRLIEEDAAEKAAKLPPPVISQNLVLYPTREQYRQWEEAAFNAADKPKHLEDWAIEGLDRMAKQWIYSQQWKNVAEEPTPSGGTPTPLPDPEPEEGNGTEGN